MSRVLTSTRIQHLLLAGAGNKPTVPSPATLTPADAGWKATDIMQAEWAYNATDGKWYYRDKDNNIREYWDAEAIDFSETWVFDRLYYMAAYTATGNLEIAISATATKPNGGVFAQITLDGTQSLTFRGDGIAYTLGGDMIENGETLAAGTYTVVALWGNDAVSISVALVNESGTLAVANRAPVASSVAISGTVAVGQTLTGSYTFTDEDGDSESGSTFVWQRSDNGTSGWANIGSATATTYVVQSADEGKYLRFGVTPSDGTDAGTQAFSASTIQVPDATAPTLSNVSVSDVTGTTANFNAQLSEAGTIFWAVYPAATGQQNTTAIQAGTGAVDYGNIVTAGGSIETDAITGLDDETAYKVHYFAKDTANNASAAAMTSQFTTGDITAPTLSAASIENATPNRLDLTFDEATTITTAGWSMSATGGAVTISSVVSGSGTTTPKLGLSRSIANGETVTVSYNPATGATTDANGNELAEISGAAVTNNVDETTIVLFSDNFTGETIDTEKWTVTDPSDAVTISQNNALIFTNAATGTVASTLTNNVTSIETFSSCVVQFTNTSSNINNNSTRAMSLRNAGGTNYAQCFNIAANGNIHCRIFIDGSQVYTYISSVLMAGAKIKITNISGAIKFWYWDGSEWDEIDAATSKNHNLGSGLSVFFGHNKANSSNSGVCVFDDVYVSSADYSTEFPT